jgi:CBS domain-containing protein
MYKCRDVMKTELLYCLPGDPVVNVAEMMTNTDVGPVIIVEDEMTRKLTGIVTDYDLTTKVLAAGRDPYTTKVEEVMTRKVFSVRADDDVFRALMLMNQLQLRRVPVVDRSERIVGILTQADAVTRFVRP